MAVKCKYCSREVSGWSDTCAYCAREVRKGRGAVKLLALVLGLAMLAMVVYGLVMYVLEGR